MATTFDRLLQDPVIFSASLLLLAAIAFLLWILSKLQHEGADNGLSATLLGAAARKPSPTSMTSAEVSGIAEAHLNEISAQIADINRRFAYLEKLLQALPASQTETLMNRMAPLLKTHQSSPTTVDLSQIETKLNGIHKLLILLTDSGSRTNNES